MKTLTKKGDGGCLDGGEALGILGIPRILLLLSGTVLKGRKAETERNSQDKHLFRSFNCFSFVSHKYDKKCVSPGMCKNGVIRQKQCFLNFLVVRPLTVPHEAGTDRKFPIRVI